MNFAKAFRGYKRHVSLCKALNIKPFTFIEWVNSDNWLGETITSVCM